MPASQRSARTLVTITLALLFGVACGESTAPAAPQLGDWLLRDVNGSAMPAVLHRAAGDSIRYDNGIFGALDGRAFLQLSYAVLPLPTGVAPQEHLDTASYAYTTRGDSVFLTPAGCAAAGSACGLVTIGVITTPGTLQLLPPSGDIVELRFMPMPRE